ncbi:related to cell division-associated protein [Phialocephala subalpina]|uniref:separase n=1 Tax=Phialocephala subalpina TaxID=576137 RepID=A0A1L7WNV5_9HELO|nr:related to cell division-associated protein [Phialocephala subalpina]
MSTAHATAESIRAALSSPSTCTPATSTILSNLLLPKPDVQTSTTSIKSRKPASASATAKSKPTKALAAKSRVKKGSEDGTCEDGGRLSPKEAFILATEVINTTLKCLSDAIKVPAQTSVRKQLSSKDLVKASARKTLRRSNSLPQSPLQPRSLNRVISTPNIRECRSSSSASIGTSTHQPMAECARVAFACLRALQASKSPGMELPPLQLENGMSTLIGKLISLGLDDLAIKELRILKRRLEAVELTKTAKSGPTPKTSTTSAAPTLASLLDFGIVGLTGAKLGLVITTQLQVLRLMTSSRNPKQAEDALPTLNLDHPSSPTKLLLQAAQESQTEKQTEKVARQLQTLSELVLSLCPSLSSADDALALEPRLSVSPEVAVQLQTLALHDRFVWWGLAKHRGDLSKDIHDPFLRCLSTFARRSQCSSRDTYDIVLRLAEDLLSFQSDCSKPQPGPLKTVLGGIYRLLGSLSREADCVDDAIKWTKQVRELLDARADSQAKRCSVVARLVGLTLRNVSSHTESEELLFALLEELDRPFKGEPSEIDELVNEVSGARRSAISVLAQFRQSSESSDGATLSDGMRQMCESLVFLCPRLALRYLGNSPDGNSSTKDVLRHGQRRQFITKFALNSIDSTLFLVKLLIGEDQISWDLVDSKLQDCVLLLDRVFSNGQSSDESGSTHYARISNLYFTQFLNMRRNPEKTKEGQQIRAVRRSIDCIRTRPKHEKRIAQFTKKLERMAEFCKAMKRYDEVYQTLLLIRDEMIGDGVLSTIAENAESKSLDAIWDESDQSRSFGRTLESLLKVGLKCLKPAAQGRLLEETWSDDEKAAVLEYQLEILCKRLIDSETAKALQSNLITDLLSIYDNQRYPLRRLRVLIRLLSLNFDRTEEGLKLLEQDLESSRIEGLIVSNTRDEGLQRYCNHLKKLTTSLLQLRQQRPQVEVFKQVLSSWSASRKRCETLTALEHEIEDVPGLLVQLQTMAEYLNMKGHGTLALATLRLNTDLNELCESLVHPDDLVLNLVRLGSQWLQLGYSGKAGLALDRATTYSNRNGVTSYAKLHCRIMYCEYLLTLGSFDKAQESLNCAQELYSQEAANFSTSQSSSKTLEYTRMQILISHAYNIHAMLAYERGAAHAALSQAKQGVRILRCTWAIIERQEHRSVSKDSANPQTGIENLTEEVSQLKVSTISVTAPQPPGSVSTMSGLWPLVPSLFRGLSYVSQLFAHNGMSQEMIYYAEQAQKVAEMAESEVHLAIASINLGSAWLRSGGLEKGSDLLLSAQRLCLPNPESRESATLSYHLGIMHGLLGDFDSEIEAYNTAETTLKAITKASHIDLLDKVANESEVLEQKMLQLTITKKKALAPRKPASRAKPTLKSKVIARAKSPVEPILSVAEECRQITSFLATVLRQKAQSLMGGKSGAAIESILEDSAKYTQTQIEIVHQGFATAKRWLLESLDQMDADPVYSVLQDSTISFPSVLSQPKAEKVGDRLSAVKASPPQKTSTRGNRDRSGSKSPVPGSFFDKLRQAHELLTEVHSIAIHIAPLPVINKTSALLNSVAILLSAVGQAKGRTITSPGLASSSIETARTLALRRERIAILADPYLVLKMNEVSWPQTSLRESRRLSMGLPCDMTRFQREYIDIIPKAWTVISISLGDSRQELCISKLQAGLNPFILRLPLGRHNSMDADEEVFGFEQGRAELTEILALANESSHDAANRTSRDDKKAWWEEREALDARMRDLLENVEKVWLGGFTGIFSQHARHVDLLARFQKSFSNILDRHLPSRRRTKGRHAAPRVALDTRILDLFIGLGDASDEECDLSEPLTDLLYFVVDVLQFHGELNAYAEIDFDSIVVETHDALRSYHAAVHSAGYAEENRHTILVLDKALHSLPWESLPCMDGLAVSRVPSLGCLRDRVLAQQKSTTIDKAEGYYISRVKGSYILNPEGDLKNTQMTFQKSLEKLDGWQGITNRSPSEEEFKDQLLSKDLLLYFGHGSGAQYIRAKEIRKLGACAVAMLMGCSSGALTEAGEFEPYGPPVNYMHAGCPALVATLWDVTDKDIDRFAKSTFEHWGLLESEPQGKGKGRKKVEETHNVSLAEAVARGRAACNLRYLNGASVCIYGVPVYLQ